MSNVLTVNMTQLTELAEPIMDAGFPLLIMGRHGIGKSEFVKQIAKKKGMEVVEQRPSVMSEGDLTGLPHKGPSFTTFFDQKGTSTEWSPPSWFLKACSEAVILFFDEADRGTMEVAQGIFQINDSRALNGYRLHPGTMIVACINGGAYGQFYQVREMDLAEFDRYTKFQLEPTVEEFVNWAEENLIPEISSFFKEKSNEKFLEHTDRNSAPEPGRIYPTRRSWARAAQTIKKAMPNGINEGNHALARNIVSGFVGIDAANAFVSHAVSYVRVVDPKILFLKGRTDVLSGFTTMDHADFLKKSFEANIFTQEILSQIDKSVFVKYTKSLPAELLPELIAKVVYSNTNSLGTVIETLKLISAPELNSYINTALLGAVKKAKEEANANADEEDEG